MSRGRAGLEDRDGTWHRTSGAWHLLRETIKKLRPTRLPAPPKPNVPTPLCILSIVCLNLLGRKQQRPPTRLEDVVENLATPLSYPAPGGMRIGGFASYPFG